MPRCDTCGNDYARAFQVVREGRTHTFDCFECAIHALAPRCSHCACTIIGHGLEHEDRTYCCAHCAREAGVMSLVDHA
jgi:hypothetical protein